MKKKIMTFFLLIILVLTSCKVKSFRLEEKYYVDKGNGYIIEDNDAFYNAIENKESLIVKITGLVCLLNDFSDNVNKYAKENGVIIYSIIGTKDNDFFKEIEYYPSLVLINKGKIIKYLDASSNEDEIYYSNYESLEKWINSYIIV